MVWPQVPPTAPGSKLPVTSRQHQRLLRQRKGRRAEVESAEMGDLAEAEIHIETSCVPSFPVKPLTEAEVAVKLSLTLCWFSFGVNLWFTFMSNSILHHVLSHCHFLNLPEYLIMTNICLSCVRLDQPNRRATQNLKACLL